MERHEIEDVKARNPVEEVVARYVELRRQGRRYRALCPFHNDTDPSLVVFPDEGRWWCFGCNTGGDVIDFVMRAEGVSFREALRILGHARPLPEGRGRPRRLPSRSAPPPTSTTLNDAHQGLLTAAAEVYRAALHQSPHALDYLTERGISPDVAEEFKVGYGVALAKYLRFRGWDPRLARELGLLDERGREWFRGRIVIPEYRDGRAVYLAGRQIPRVASFGPKYLFLRNIPKPLYGLERIQNSPDVFVVEGLIDYLILWGWGYPTVALLGNRIPRRHAEALRGRRVYLVPDRDDGGRELWREARRLFPEMRTVVMPEGIKDVGELVLVPRAHQAFGRLVDKAV